MTELLALARIVTCGWVWELIPENDRRIIAQRAADLSIRELDGLLAQREQSATQQSLAAGRAAALELPEPGQAAPTPQELAAPVPAAPSVMEVPFGETEDHSYEDFALMLDGLGVTHVPAAMGRFFRDVGGWDRSNPEQRDELYRKMRQYYSDHPPGQNGVAVATTKVPPAQVTMNACPRCGGPAKLIPAGVSRQGRKFNAFYRCDNQPECKTSYGGREKSVSWATPKEWQARWTEAAMGRVG